jgi:hypothetical protein
MVLRDSGIAKETVKLIYYGGTGQVKNYFRRCGLRAGSRLAIVAGFYVQVEPFWKNIPFAGQN